MPDDEILVCVPPGMAHFTDNISGVCSQCGCAIVWRSHAPQCRRLCIGCAMEIMRREAAEVLLLWLATAGKKAS